MAVVTSTAVTTAAPTPAEVTPGVGVFVRLKLRLIRNGLRQPRRATAFVLGLIIGGIFAFAAALAFLASGTAPRGVQAMVAIYAGSAIVAGWTLLPLLFFGVDETLDPARFALLPVRRGPLARGMFAAAFVGTPAVLTLLASLGLVLAAGVRFGALVGAAALVGVSAGLALGVVGSRAVTSAFATALRSRRTRDLAIVVIAVLASSLGPAQLLLQSAIMRGNLAQARLGASILSWTPLGAPYAVPFDIAFGHWLAAVGHAAETVGAFVVLFWWWSRTIESAMLAVNTGAAPRPSRRPARSPVTALVPWFLRGAHSIVGRSIIAVELRLWWRDPRRRASLASMVFAMAVVAIAVNGGFNQGQATLGDDTIVLRFGFAFSMCGVLAGMMLANQFAYDGNAYAAHVLAQVPGRVQLRARAAAAAIISLPLQIVVVVAVALLTGGPEQLPAGLGLLASAFGVSTAVAGFVSVLAAYPLPDSTNPFAVNSGGASSKAFIALGSSLGTFVLCAPIVVVALLIANLPAGTWLVLAAGVAYGAIALAVGIAAAGRLLDRRGPELLIAVSPHR